MKSIEARGSRGDFVSTVARDDNKDLRLQRILSKYLGGQEAAAGFYHEPLTLSALRGDVMLSMKSIVDTSHFWMSDHSRFWYHLEENADNYNLGAVLISDTGTYLLRCLRGVLFFLSFEIYKSLDLKILQVICKFGTNRLLTYSLRFP